MNRKSFLLQSGLLAGMAGIGSLPILGQAPPNRPQKGEPLDKKLVQEFVGAAHKDMDKVKEMLQTTPDLLNSVHNLGGWDWEDAIGASGHVGLRDLTLYLLAQGARPTICTAAMLGEIELVKTFVKTFPAMKDAVGPHKISLLRHARAGGEHARETAEWLESIGAKA
jgi:hypothetical protein